MSSLIPASGAAALSLDAQLKAVKLPEISKVTTLVEQWSPNIENLRKKLKKYFDSQPVQIEDTNLETIDIIRNNNYPGESFEIVTPDDCVLTIFRIPHAANKPRVENKRPLLLVHGLLSSSDDWLKLGVENALGYTLADEYDVWLGNCRETRYSKKHGEFQEDRNEFWDFTLHEMAIFDVSTMIDFVLNHTNQPRLYYVGYCQGTTLSYILCSEMPEYNEKIIVNVSLAPVAFTKHVQNPVFKIIEHLTEKNELEPYFTNANYALHDEVRRKSAKFINCKNSNNDILCLNDLFVTFGFNPKNISPALLPILLNDSMVGRASMNQFLHYSQLTKSGNFCGFDYGILNASKYDGELNPPEYSLGNITSAVVLFVSEHDWFSRVEDIKTLKSKLTNAAVQTVNIDSSDGSEYTHLDFLYGSDVAKKVYLPLMQQLSKYE